MPVIKREVTAATENAVNGLRFSKQKGPSAISLWLCTATAGEVATFGIDDVSFAENVYMNVQAGAGILDVSRDQILFREPCPAGELVLAFPAAAGQILYHINIETL